MHISISINLSLNPLFSVGIVLLVLSSLFLVVGVIVTVLFCSGVLGGRNAAAPQVSLTTQPYLICNLGI